MQLEQKEKGCAFWQIIILNKEQIIGLDIYYLWNFLSFFFRISMFWKKFKTKKIQKWILECQVLDAICVVPLLAKGRVLPM